MPKLSPYVLILMISFWWLPFSFVSSHTQEEAHVPIETVAKSLLGHVGDHHTLHIGEVELPLPIIAYRKGSGWFIFSSKRMYNAHHQPTTYQGFRIEQGILSSADGTPTYDFSITKNVLFMLLAMLFLLLTFLGLALSLRRKPNQIWRGFTLLPMFLIRFVRNDIAKKEIGEAHYERFTPYLLTLFFYILCQNLFGLLPEGANITGNLSITFTLALVTFLFTHRHASKAYWKHLFAPPGVPVWMYPILIPIELLSALLRPCILAIRLFANMFSGHLILLSLLGSIVVVGTMSFTGGIFVSIIMVPLSVAMVGLKIFVSFIQAYVFTLLSASTLGTVVQEH